MYSTYVETTDINEPEIFLMIRMIVVKKNGMTTYRKTMIVGTWVILLEGW